MIREMRFTRFRVLQNATLKPGPLTLLIGPNGSGKSTVLGALELLRILNVGGAFAHHPTYLGDEYWRLNQLSDSVLDLRFTGKSTKSYAVKVRFTEGEVKSDGISYSNMDEGSSFYPPFRDLMVFNLEADGIAGSATLSKYALLSENGFNLVGILDRLRDSHPERFEELNRALSAWLPEFDRILFSVPADGQRAFELRQKHSKRAIPAKLLSQGTRIALFLLTLAYLPSPPPIIGLEEPDRGLHPRLLKDVRDALYRLAYPDRFGENRAPVQVFATTHSPYFLDLFRDHPEQIVVCDKKGEEATFTPLSEMPHLEDILGDSHLGEAWFTGVLGGVPAGT